MVQRLVRRVGSRPWGDSWGTVFLNHSLAEQLLGLGAAIARASAEKFFFAGVREKERKAPSALQPLYVNYHGFS